MALKFMEVATTPAVQEAQRHYYGREPNITPGVIGERTSLGPDETAFIAERDSFYLATVSETDWPYIQHRGGPPGFLRVRDAHTLAFADLKGNRQLLSTGNLSGGNDRVALFLMDYPQRTRLKIMGHARVFDARTEPALAARIAPDAALLARTERVFVVDVVSFDWNCPQYITARFKAGEVETYPAWQKWLREHQPSVLVLWGRFDASFAVAGVETYRQNVPPRRNPRARRGPLRHRFVHQPTVGPAAGR